MSELESIGKLRGLPFHGTNGFGNCVTASKETINSIADEIEREVAGRFMALPCDVDGVPIRVGDEIQQINHAGVWTDVMPVIAVDESGCFALAHGLACEARTYVWGNNCRHVKPRTLEDVLRDMQQDTLTSQGEYSGEVIDADEWRNQLKEQVNDYADEIRAMFGEDN